MHKQEKVKKYYQKFRKEWLTNESLKDWLIEVPGNPEHGRCRYCQCNINARLSDLLTHSKSKKHSKAAEPFSSERQAKIEFPTVRRTAECASSEAALTLFVVNHCAIRSVDHLCDLTKRCFKEADQASTMRIREQSVIKNVLFPHFKSELKLDIGNGRYSVLLDESTDITVTKLLAVCIVYFSETQCSIVSTFLGMIDLHEGTADAIVNALKSLLSEYDLNLQNLRGVGTDNVQVMVGINNGLYKKLKEGNSSPCADSMCVSFYTTSCIICSS